MAPVPSSAPSGSLLRNVSWLDPVYSSPYSLDIHLLLGTLKVGDVSRVRVFQMRSSLDKKKDKHTNYLLIKPNPWPHLIDLHGRGRQNELHRSVDLPPHVLKNTWAERKHARPRFPAAGRAGREGQNRTLHSVAFWTALGVLSASMRNKMDGFPAPSILSSGSVASQTFCVVVVRGTD